MRPSVVIGALGCLALALAACELALGELPPVGASVSGSSVSSTSSSISSSTSTTGASSGGGARGSSATSSSGPVSSAASSGTTSSGAACCDCDGDHVKAEGACGADDCDDHDPLVYPGEPTYYAQAAANAAIGFDYDCSGAPDPNPTLNHTVSCMAIGLPCQAGEGYLATVPPPCGHGGPWGTCKQQGVQCVDDVIDAARVMTCK